MKMDKSIFYMINEIRDNMNEVLLKLNRVNALMLMPQRLDRPYLINDMPNIENTQVFTDAEALEQATA
jgi:hypothetical protein